ncbi:hypothetical protein A1Q1_01841 [Trichosporon asahii var. asahii CBS 2479]|uniref:Uncharacterized protein n=1 Tax=Trichosporon asahii var. asahii (strain ATCC 90039 / CBS 2479 / JCM 2466 / KCTC 7840 / NBRC 103889/ NCYC 2677 / UAMH 7654) TaxID=1186058 RepID=J5TTT6_TRIAS|nr:hypothetical protein A1Q1_01841 [Trichosporon asahii var. asahii CBS 2479]EJT52801.1 hypothetical protein A1Q1_01841 [Trichosporon asahii var. asahii CBS 2479]
MARFIGVEAPARGATRKLSHDEPTPEPTPPTGKMTLRSATRATPPPSYTYAALTARKTSPPAKKRSRPDPPVKTERSPSLTPMHQWEKSRRSDFPVPYRHASARSSVALPPPRPRRKRVLSVPEDLRHAASQVHTKLALLGVSPSEPELVRLVLPVLLGRLYDREHLWDHLVQASLKRQVTSKAPGTALLSRLNHAWNERNFRYEIAASSAANAGCGRGVCVRGGGVAAGADPRLVVVTRNGWLYELSSNNGAALDSRQTKETTQRLGSQHRNGFS